MSSTEKSQIKNKSWFRSSQKIKSSYVYVCFVHLTLLLLTNIKIVERVVSSQINWVALDSRHASNCLILFRRDP